MRKSSTRSWRLGARAPRRNRLGHPHSGGQQRRRLVLAYLRRIAGEGDDRWRKHCVDEPAMAILAAHGYRAAAAGQATPFDELESVTVRGRSGGEGLVGGVPLGDVGVESVVEDACSDLG